MSAQHEYRPLTETETAEWLAGHVDFPGAVETEHGVMVPAQPMLPGTESWEVAA